MENKPLVEAKSAFFTGHRKIDKETSDKISYVLDILLRNLAYAGITTFYAGGALGFDTLAAQAVLRLKNRLPELNVRLELILPCKNQTKFWSDEDISVYNDILRQADRVEYIHETYTSTCMHERNHRLVELGDVGVSYLRHSGGGTAYTVGYAAKMGKEMISVDDLVDSM